MTLLCWRMSPPLLSRRRMLRWRCLVGLVVLGLSGRSIGLLCVWLRLTLCVLWLLWLLLLIQLRSVVGVVVLRYNLCVRWLSSLLLTVLEMPLLRRWVGRLWLMSTVCRSRLLYVGWLLGPVLRISRSTTLVSAAVAAVRRPTSASASGMATALCLLLVWLAVWLLVRSRRSRRRSWGRCRRRRPVTVGHRLN